MTKAPYLGEPFSQAAVRLLNLPILLSALAIAALPFLSGCASIQRSMPGSLEAWDPGVEIRFPACQATGGSAPASGEDDSEVRMVAAAEVPMPPLPRFARALAAVMVFTYDQVLSVVPRPLMAVSDLDDVKFTLIPGAYAFEYDTTGLGPVYGEIKVYPVCSPRARDFIRHSSILVTPGPSGRHSVLSDADLARVRGGDVVTKVVFMAHLPAVNDRLNDIDRGLRELARVRTSLEEQRSYWERKLADRRLNTRYSSDFGWGVDVPAVDLALLQTIVGPERYHWHRFSQAEDKVRTYEEKLAQLETPERNLEEERDALKKLLHSVDVIHRTDNLMVLAPSMIRPYHDPVYEVGGLRGLDVWADNYRGKLPFEGDDWIGPLGRIHFPYLYSSLSMGGLMPGLRPVVAPSAALSKNIGEVLMVITVGARRPHQLGGHSWVGAG